MSLRVRSIGRRRVQTFKWPPKGAEGVFARGEVEAAIETDAPQPDLLGPEAEAIIARTIAGMALEPRSQTTFGRRIAMIEHQGALIEAALDTGRIHAGERKAVISELELELKRGNPVALYDFALRFMDRGFRVTAAPKGLRGHWLATGVSAAEVKARQPVLLPRHPAGIGATAHAVRRQLAGLFARLSGGRPPDARGITATSLRARHLRQNALA